MLDWLRLLVEGKERGRGNGKSMDDAIDALETNELWQLLILVGSTFSHWPLSGFAVLAFAWCWVLEYWTHSPSPFFQRLPGECCMIQDDMKRRSSETYLGAWQAWLCFKAAWGPFYLAWWLLLVDLFHLISCPPNVSRDSVASLMAACFEETCHT